MEGGALRPAPLWQSLIFCDWETKRGSFGLQCSSVIISSSQSHPLPFPQHPPPFKMVEKVYVTYNEVRSPLYPATSSTD